MARKPLDAFDLTLTPTERQRLGDNWSREIEDALNARDEVIGPGGKLDYFDWFYEQGQTPPERRVMKNGADLTSYFITENVDALRSRLMRAVQSAEPLCTVDGWGDDAKKAPAVEEFLEWQLGAEDSPFVEELARFAHAGLLEDCAILEVREKVETRRIVEEIDVALELNEQGGAIFENGQPRLKRDDAGEPVLAQPNEPAAKAKRDRIVTKRLGPEFDVISMRDFVFLPGHAKNRGQLWGYAKRFWQRLSDIKEKAADKIYDPAAVELIGSQSDREDARTPATVNSVAPQLDDGSIEKELFELSIKRDLDGDGREEWYLATVSIKHRALLRLKRDTFVQRLGRPRCVPFVACPRRDSVYGYTYAEKLLTLAEEHTALRNTATDRNALAANAPLKKKRGATWDPDDEPFQVGGVITVTEQDDVTPFVIPDVPQSTVFLLRDVYQAKERVGGLSDVGFIGSGQRTSNTLGQDQLVAAASNIRVEEILGHFRRAIAEAYSLGHAIWVDALADDKKGLDVPASVATALELRGSELAAGRFTADMLRGKFRFKPYGSVETANLGQQQQQFNLGLQNLAGMAKVFSPLGMLFQDYEVCKAILEEWCRVNRVRNRAPFIKALKPPAPMAMPQPGMTAPMTPGASPGGGAPQNPAALLAMLTGGPNGNPNVQ